MSSRRARETVGVSPGRKLYDGLTDDLLYDPAVGRSTMMGYPCVRRAGRFFASFDTRADALVVKVSRDRVVELIGAGIGEPFVPNGRVFREWVTVRPLDSELWEELNRPMSRRPNRSIQVALVAAADPSRPALLDD